MSVPRELGAKLAPAYNNFEEKILREFSTENEGPTLDYKEDPEETLLDADASVRDIEDQCIRIWSPKIPTENSFAALLEAQRTLLHRQRNFFQAFSNLMKRERGATPERLQQLQRVPDKYMMRKRVSWNAMHSLKFMRQGLPGSLDSLLELLRVVYGTVAILYDIDPASGEGVPSVPRFCWIKNLGYAATNYWRVMEAKNSVDRAKWLSISQYWLLKASWMSDTDGELYNLLAILAESDAVKWLYYCSKAFCVPKPAFFAWKHIQNLFAPALASDAGHPDSYEAAFVRVHGILFCGENHNELQPSIDEFTDLLQKRLNDKKVCLESSCYMAISLICSLFGYGAADNPLRRRLPNSANAPPRNLSDTIDTATADRTFQAAMSFAVKTWKLFLSDASDDTNLPFFHITMSFLYYMAHYTEAMLLITDRLPWAVIAAKLNKCKSAKHQSASPRRLPEDDAMGGLFLSSSGWSSDVDYENATEMSQNELKAERDWRILRLGHKLAELRWRLRWDETAGRYKDM